MSNVADDAPDGKSAAHHELCRLAIQAFEQGTSVIDAVVELGLAAMRLGFELDEAEKIIQAQYKLCSERESLEQTLKRLASLDNARYELVRREEAKRLNMRLFVLDGEVWKVRQSEHPKTESPKPPPQWAPAAAVFDLEVDGSELLVELISAIRGFVLMTQSDALIIALWILFTWLFERIAETSPFLRIVSPTAECGKSTLLKIIKYLARSSWLLVRLSQSSFVRTMEKERRSLLLDEGDAFLAENEVMRNVLDGASDPDTANVSMSVKCGDDWVPTEFNIFVPIAIASIGMLRRMQTVESRSVHVHLKRATPAELKSLAKGRRRELKDRLEPLAAKCARWAADNADRLVGARPALPEALSGRDMDKWEPLIAIANAISQKCGTAALAACEAATGTHAGDSLSEMLLADLKVLFDTRNAKALASIDICNALKDLDERPWGEMGRARKPITQRGLAGLLSRFEIVPGTVRLDDGTTPKGYKRADLEDAFSRYLHMIDDPIRQNDTTQRPVGESDDFQSATEQPCGASKNGSNPLGENDCGGMSDKNGDHGSRQKNNEAEEAELDRLAGADGWQKQPRPERCPCGHTADEHIPGLSECTKCDCTSMYQRLNAR